MTVKKFGKLAILILVVFALLYGVYYAWYSFPIISGYSAKNACSCAFIQGRTKEQISREELGSFPLSIGSFDINVNDSSVTASVFGMAKKKAVFRNHLGCTLVNDLPESTIRAQDFYLPQTIPAVDSVGPAGIDLPVVSITGAGKQKLDDVVRFAFQEKFKGKVVHTRALLVIHNDSVLAERYAPGYTKNSLFLGWSMAKSVTSALIGILVKEGKLDPSLPAPVTQWSNPADKRHAITLENLLQQCSGLDFVEDYGSYSNVTNMLFNKGDMAGYTASLPLKYTPGTQFNYSSGNSNILSGIIRRTVGEKDYHAFPYSALFYKLGMYHTLLEPDASGTYIGSSFIYASARDYARFGMLYLQDGAWKGERILPEGWVQKTITPAKANPLKNYGYQFWLNGYDKNDPSKREYPEAPADMFLADGFGGQRIYIIPSLNVVAVRMGLNMFDEHAFLKQLVEAVK